MNVCSGKGNRESGEEKELPPYQPDLMKGEKFTPTLYINPTRDE